MSHSSPMAFLLDAMHHSSDSDYDSDSDSYSDSDAESREGAEVREEAEVREGGEPDGTDSDAEKAQRWMSRTNWWNVARRSALARGKAPWQQTYEDMVALPREHKSSRVAYTKQRWLELLPRCRDLLRALDFNLDETSHSGVLYTFLELQVQLLVCSQRVYWRDSPGSDGTCVMRLFVLLCRIVHEVGGEPVMRRLDELFRSDAAGRARADTWAGRGLRADSPLLFSDWSATMDAAATALWGLGPAGERLLVNQAFTGPHISKTVLRLVTWMRTELTAAQSRPAEPWAAYVHTGEPEDAKDEGESLSGVVRKPVQRVLVVLTSDALWSPAQYHLCNVFPQLLLVGLYDATPPATDAVLVLRHTDGFSLRRRPDLLPYLSVDTVLVVRCCQEATVEAVAKRAIKFLEPHKAKLEKIYVLAPLGSPVTEMLETYFVRKTCSSIPGARKVRVESSAA